MARAELGVRQARLHSGRVAGVLDAVTGVVSYKGIPFAAAPVGARRWQAPAPLPEWSGILQADRYGDAPMQPLHGADHFLAQFGFADEPECGISEHCLYLNVWTPATAEPGVRLPVMLWVYGGGHRVGSASHPVSDGTAWAQSGMVVVSANYRLSGLGYLAHPLLTAESGSSGNYACLDVLAALRWIRENVDAFGGDPDCVTLFGQSAGAVLVNVLMASPLAVVDGKPLFHRAIAHSAGRFRGGPMGAMKSLNDAEAAGAALIAESVPASTSASVSSSLHSMRALPADRLYGNGGAWGPIIDGQVLSESVSSVFERGAQLKIPLLVGFCSDDATPFPNPEWHSRQGLDAHIDRQWHHAAAEIRQLYPYRNDAEAQLQSYALRRDISFAYQAWQFAAQHARTGAPCYLFEFQHAVPLPADQLFHGARPPQGYGAYHGAELWYVFNTLGTKRWPWAAGDRALAELMGRYWQAFCRDGRPGSAEQAKWLPFDLQHHSALLLDERPESGQVSNQRALQFFSELFSAA